MIVRNVFQNYGLDLVTDLKEVSFQEEENQNCFNGN